MKRRRASALVEQSIALVWGFAEGTLFFIVPDVYLSWLAVDRRRRGFAACVPAVAGAMLGGAAMWLWGRVDLPAALAALDRIPAVRPDMLARVQEALESRGLWPMLFGPLRGTPYKIYATTWGGLDGGLIELWLMSVPARGLRFVLVTALASWAIGKRLSHRSLALRRSVLLGCWAAFYVGYFLAMRAP